MKAASPTVNLQKVEGYNRDSYRRLLRTVRLGSTNINAWMIRNGRAFSDREHEHDRQEYYNQLEDEAREDDVGLWSYRCNYDTDTDEEFEFLGY